MIACHIAHLLARCRERGYTLEEAMPCIVSRDGDTLTVDVDHPAYPREPKPGFVPPTPKASPASPPPQDGPGSELKSLLAKFGIHASPTCKCNSMARKMNDMESKEPGWCLSHIEEIVDVMEETAKARKLPFLRTAGRLLVKKAVKNWHKKATGK